MVYICKRIKEVIYTANSSKEAATRKYGKNIMKTTIDFLNGLNFKNTANFQNNVIKTLPEGVEKVYLSTVGMKRLGTGSYNFFLDVEINGIDITLKYFTNSSPVLDTKNNPVPVNKTLSAPLEVKCLANASSVVKAPVLSITKASLIPYAV